MNCGKLKADIAKLSERKEALEKIFEQMNETMRGNREMKEKQKEADELEDAILAEYLEDFALNNPKLFGWKYDKWIKGNESLMSISCIDAFSPISDKKVLLGGTFGALFECELDKNGDWTIVGDEAHVFKNEDRSLDEVKTICRLPNGKMIIGGYRGTLREYEYDENGKRISNRSIESVKDEDGSEVRINVIFPLSDERLLVGGVANQGVFYEYKLDENDNWRVERTIDIDDELRCNGGVRTITPLPNGRVLLGGHNTLYEYDPNQSGGLESGKKIEGLGRVDEFGRMDSNWVNSAIPLPDGSVLLSTHRALYRYGPDEEGEWKLSKEIGGG